MTSYADTQAALTAADQNGFGFITAELDSGELTMTTAEAIEMFDDLAPGEPFVIISAHRTEASPAPYVWKSPWWTFSATPTAETSPARSSRGGRRDYFQLGRSELLHVVIVDPESEVDLTLCGRDIYETGRNANDVEDQPICTHCRRKFDKLPK